MTLYDDYMRKPVILTPAKDPILSIVHPRRNLGMFQAVRGMLHLGRTFETFKLTRVLEMGRRN